MLRVRMGVQAVFIKATCLTDSIRTWDFSALTITGGAKGTIVSNDATVRRSFSFLPLVLMTGVCRYPEARTEMFRNKLETCCPALNLRYQSFLFCVAL